MLGWGTCSGVRVRCFFLLLHPHWLDCVIQQRSDGGRDRGRYHCHMKSVSSGWQDSSWQKEHICLFPDIQPLWTLSFRCPGIFLCLPVHFLELPEALRLVLLGRETFKMASGQLLPKNQSHEYILPYHMSLLFTPEAASELSELQTHSLIFPGTCINHLNAKNRMRP